MPLLNDDLDNKLLLVTPDETIEHALRRLDELGGQDNWDIFVQWAEGTYGVLPVARLKDLLLEIGPPLFERTFNELRRRVTGAVTVQQDSIGIGAAERLAFQQSPAVLLVLRGEQIAGRLSVETHLGGGLKPSMGEIYRSYINTPTNQRNFWRPEGFDVSQEAMTGGKLSLDGPAVGPKPSVPAYKDYVSTGFAPEPNYEQPLSPETPLAAGQKYTFWLSVGAPQRNVIDMEQVRLEVEKFPVGAKFAVVLYSFKNELEILPGANLGLLKLLPDGTVVVDRQPVKMEQLYSNNPIFKEKLFFPVKAPEREGTFRLRCSIYYNQVLVQSRLVYASVMREPSPVKKALMVELDYKLAHTPAAPVLAKIPEHQLSIMLNSDGGGTHSFRYFGGNAQEPFTEEVSLDEHMIQSLIDDTRCALSQVSWGDVGPWTGSAGQQYRYDSAAGSPSIEMLKSDLVSLAVKGYRMYDSFSRELMESAPNVRKLQQLMRAPAKVQVALKVHSRFVLPAALFYDYPIDTNLPAYQLCPAFTVALQASVPLEEQQCFKGNCPSYGQMDVVCPSGFWGFRHEIGLPVSESDQSDVAWEIEYENIPSLTVCVSTDDQLIERREHLDTIQHLLSKIGWTYADSREQSLNALKQPADVVYFYCHGGLYGAKKPYLSVGTKNEMGITPDNLSAYGIYWENPRPLVIINGCHTTAVEPEVAQNFVDAFVRTSNASGVIGSEITIFEPLATDFAEGFLGRFLRGIPLGEAVRRTRLAMLKAGNPLGLVYIPFALPSLKMVPRATPPVG